MLYLGKNDSTIPMVYYVRILGGMLEIIQVRVVAIVGQGVAL